MESTVRLTWNDIVIYTYHKREWYGRPWVEAIKVVLYAIASAPVSGHWFYIASIPEWVEDTQEHSSVYAALEEVLRRISKSRDIGDASPADLAKSIAIQLDPASFLSEVKT